MKKILLLFATFSLALVSCRQEIDPADPMSTGDEVTVNIVPAIPDTFSLTKAPGANANSGKGGITNIDWASYDLRYILAIYKADGSALAKPVMKEFKNATNLDATFSLRLVPGNYKLVLWADFVTAGDQANDLHYSTADLKNVTMINGYAVNDESRDAYFAIKDLTVGDASFNESITLKRPFGKVRVVTNDIQDLNSGTVPTSVKITYPAGTIPNGINAVEGTLLSGTNGSAVSYTANVNTFYQQGHDAAAANQTLFTDYIFGIPAGQSAIKFTIETYDQTSALIRSRNFNTDIPIQRNYLTTLMGSILTTSGNISIDIDENFGGGIELSPVVTAANLGQVLDINSVLPGIIENLTITDLVAADETIKIEKALVNGSLIFNFAGGIAAGKTITFVDEDPGDAASQFAGVVNIFTDNASVGDITLTLPKATVRIYNSVGQLISETAPNTLIIMEGAKIGKLVLKQGNVEINGTVGDVEVESSAVGAVVNVGVKGDITGSAVNIDAKFYWKASTGEQLHKILQKDAAMNHGVTLTDDVRRVPATVDGAGANQNSFVIGTMDDTYYDTGDQENNPRVNEPYNGYVFDGGGFTMSGFAYNNIFQIMANDVTVKNLVIEQSDADRAGMVGKARSNGNNAISIHQSLNVSLENVTIKGMKKAAVIVGGSTVTATGLKTSGNVWGGVNVSYPGSLAVASIGISPEFTFDNTCEIADANPVWVDWKDGHETRWTVNTPDSDWTSNTNTTAKQTYYSINVNGIIGNAPAGSTVVLKPVAYAGPITVDKAITIQGVPGTMITGNGDSPIKLQGVTGGEVRINDVVIAMSNTASGAAIKLDQCDDTEIVLKNSHIVVATAANGNRMVDVTGNSAGTVTTITLDNTHFGSSATVLSHPSDESGYTDAEIADTRNRTYTRGVNIGPNEGKVLLNITNGSVLEKVYYAINATSVTTDVEVNVENSTLDAWAVLNLWGTGNSVYNFRNSTLIGRNYYPAGPSNDFANFVINQGAENAVINIEDSQLIMFSKTTNKQYAVSARTTATIPINITGNTKIVDRTNSLDYVISKNNNTGVVFSIAPTVSVIGKQGASLEEN